jgi:glycosyltransferase involved in cell wall biosynthesis
MKISFLITCHNEKESLQKLLHILEEFIKNNNKHKNIVDPKDSDEIIILDDFSDDKFTIDLLELTKQIPFVKVIQHKLDKNYSEHKNFGNSNCSGDYIFAIDADEYPHPYLLEILHELIEMNSHVELFYVPRINIVHGITKEYIDAHNWRTSKLEGINQPVLNFPDFQTRIYKKCDSVQWTRMLHEHITGQKVETKLPMEKEYCLIHEKNIVQQMKQNERYNKEYSIQDNIRIM